MDIGFTRDQELAAEQLRAIAPLIHLARQVFVAINMLSAVGVSGALEATARNRSMALAKSILMLEHDLKGVVAGEPV